MSLFARYQPIVLGGGVGGGIVRINSDTTSSQTLSVGTAGNNFAIVDAGSGSHVFNLPTASASNRGALSSSDWSVFNGKQAAGSYLTALSGDGVASGPGSAALTLATVNSNVGSFTNANITVNAKGLITAASNGSGGGANTSLSNLSGPTAINQNLTFSAANRTISVSASGAGVAGTTLTLSSGIAGAGTDIVGGDTIISPGNSTGQGTAAGGSPATNSAGGGNILFNLTTIPAASGSALNTYYTAASITNFNNDSATTVPAFTLQTSDASASISIGLDSGLATPWAGKITSSAALFIEATALEIDCATVIGAPSTTPTHSLNTGSTTGASLATLTNSPVSGNPHGWITIKINGVSSFIPYWQ